MNRCNFRILPKGVWEMLRLGLFLDFGLGSLMIIKEPDTRFYRKYVWVVAPANVHRAE